ncbi:BTAD domain-containing putative transcriptional regulator [Mycetocola zhujimingii]|uniref:OmpR/PhoB-type domain-containing protein n=1 Tax=Mycetocola zhujimingii TaxID=2079792 RepID=A0A2U1TC37_9MICO|nr:BTAD domain-containing putative transcriptional regulator [Mycetocola zhujimingii]PWC06455.1 hypothetical protein DF223_12765 [Mycetocola zhujimingii]
MSEPRISVFGPVAAEIDGTPLRLSKSRHREILGILITAHGHAVSTAAIIDDLWDEPGTNAIGAVRTFIGELRQLLEPQRQPRTAPRALVTVGDGYALRLNPESVDVWRAERAVAEAATAGPDRAEALLTHALQEWHDEPFAEFASRPWARAEGARLSALRADAVERLADARLALGRADEVLPLLDSHVVAYPWREAGWRMLALALYRTERQAEALATLRRAREHLADDLGLNPGASLATLEREILRNDPALDLPDRNRSLLLRTASAHSRTSSRAQLESASTLLPGLAVSGGLDVATQERMAAIAAAEQLGDSDLTARIVGGYDVPGSWTRSDDPAQSALIVEAALRMLSQLPESASGRSRARLLATVAMESRGTADRGAEAREAERLARRIGDPSLLCFALAALYMQSFETAGLAGVRERIGVEIIEIARDAELPTFEIHGRIIRMQALCALDDLEAASDEASAIDTLAARHERPLASVFPAWFRWTFAAASELPPSGEEMPGFSRGLPALAAVTAVLRRDRHASELPIGDFAPYEPWIRPLLLARAGQRAEAAAALDAVPDPPLDLMLELSWSLVGLAALEVRHGTAAERSHSALLPAANEHAAGSGVVSLGPVADILGELSAMLRST